MKKRSEYRGSVTVHCAQCGKRFSKKYSLTAAARGLQNDYCSKECYDAYRMQPVTVTCEACGKPFEVWRSRYERGNVRFCSRKCSNPARAEELKALNPRQRTTIKCATCGKEFEEVASRIKKNSRFCSTKCYGVWRKEAGLSKGKNNPGYRDGSTPKTLARMRDREWKAIADSIREERGNRCEVCGKEGGRRKLPVHHKIPWEVSNDNTPGNLLVVCQSDHARLDNIYYSQGIVPY